MGTSERPFDRGTAIARTALALIGRELREARRDRGLSLDVAARASGFSKSALSRIERGISPMVSFTTLARNAAAVGLDLSARLFPGSGPVRDAGHTALIADFKSLIHPSLRWSTEVPLPNPGDRRAWDATVAGVDWMYGVEFETRPRDAQALNRRLQLKQRDGRVDGVLLVLRDNTGNRAFVRDTGAELRPTFPLTGALALDRLQRGADPGANSIMFVSRPPRNQRGRAAALRCKA